MELLRVDRDDRGTDTVVTAAGQLDVATAGKLRQVLMEVQYGGTRQVALDLDSVEFLDSFGLGVIVGGLKRARSHGGDIVLVCSRERIRHVLSITRLDEIVRVAASIEEAFAADGAARPSHAE
ncbi:MAG: anti-sigma factor antagonist [Nitriliruptoraceae bacterium]